MWMAKRSKQSQSKHDAEVRHIAENFQKKGYEVKADIKGYSKPGTIGGYRPDVVATKGKQRKIVEVETTESVNSARDREQKQAFSKAASQSKNTNFQRRIVKTRK